jgi:flagellar motor switch protein FliN/FliY
MADSEPGKDTIVTKETELEALLDVDVEITAVLGTSMMPISQILKLGRGAVVELNRNVGEDIEIHANNRIVAHGEVVVIEDRLGVNLTDIVVMVEAQKG